MTTAGVEPDMVVVWEVDVQQIMATVVPLHSKVSKKEKAQKKKLEVANELGGKES
jgi:hypothetical protein